MGDPKEIYVTFVQNDLGGLNIRKWDRYPFEGATAYSTPSPAINQELAEAYAALKEMDDKYVKLWHRISYQRRIGFAHQDDNSLLDATRLTSETRETLRKALEKHAAAVKRGEGQ